VGHGDVSEHRHFKNICQPRFCDREASFIYFSTFGVLHVGSETPSDTSDRPRRAGMAGHKPVSRNVFNPFFLLSHRPGILHEVIERCGCYHALESAIALAKLSIVTASFLPEGI
jgi:hypothetical protein